MLKKQEIGRSMVEMLGVLAIIGLISIGGLYGYTQAMKRHRANELLNEANKRAVMVATELMAGKEPGEVTMDEVNTSYGQFTSSLEDVGDKFKMTVSGLDEEVCALMEGLSGGPIRRVECVGEETSTFTAELFFNKDLSTEERASDYTYDNCPNQFYKCEATHTCVASATECQVTCEVLECVHGTWNEAECKCDCDTGWYGKICDSTCDGFRAGSRYNYYDDDFWDCLSCSELRANFETSEEECSRCPNRQLFATYTLYLDDEGDIWDSVKPAKVIGEKVMGFCGLKDCGKNAFRMDTYVHCMSCEENKNGSVISKQECDKCTNRELLPAQGYEVGICAWKCDSLGELNGKAYFRSGLGCELCSERNARNASPADCAQCDGTGYPRKMDELNRCVPDGW